MVLDFKKLVIGANDDILSAIKTIDAGGVQIALVVNGDMHLLGTVTDGDIRRGLLKGAALHQPVSQVMNINPRTLRFGQSRSTAVELMRRLSVHQLPVIDTERRVVGIELFEELVAPQDAGTWVVLMAGGLGARLRPLTETVPKPMLPVGGRPLLETIIRNFETQGFREIFLSVNYKSELIRQHFGDGLDFGVSIEYLVEQERLGTAGALSLLPRRPNGPVIVMNGDLLTSINFRQLVDFHREQRAKATMCVREYAFQVPYGVVNTDGAHLVSIVEKPLHNFFVNAGVYVIEPDALDLIRPGEPLDMPQLFERVGKGNAVAFPIHEYWLDIGRFDDLERAQDDFKKMFDK